MGGGTAPPPRSNTCSNTHMQTRIGMQTHAYVCIHMHAQTTIMT
nr:MAG TPA: hypothetical protein [Caudoviricetes sp.]